jgi:7-carboxy-7-deazaguanine synthase
VSKELYTRVDKSITKNGKYLPLVEEFYSIQGEGFHSGKAAYFIRVGGCDIACHWCDSKLSWNAKTHPLVSIEDIVNKVLETPAQSVVVTGGEPGIYNLEPLSNLLRKHNINNFLETSGAYKLSGKWDWICLSPKNNKEPLIENLKLANELKVVIFDESDFAFAEKWKSMIGDDCKLLLQPEFSQFDKMAPKMVEYVKFNPEWNISLQSHKYLNIP